MDRKNRNIDPDQLRDFFSTASVEDLEQFLEDGLGNLISDLEMYDYFGTEGFNKRFG